MGRIINEKNVKIITDGLELLKKHLEQVVPINVRVPNFSSNNSYNVSDIEELLFDLKTQDLDKD